MNNINKNNSLYQLSNLGYGFLDKGQKNNAGDNGSQNDVTQQFF
jgi:hypothetical protein